MLEELGYVVVFLEILVTDQCTYFKRFIHVLYEQGASKILCITYNTGAGFFDASNVKKLYVGCLNFWHLVEIMFEVSILIWIPGKDYGA